MNPTRPQDPRIRTCAEAEAALSTGLNESPSPARAAALQAHRSTCAACDSFAREAGLIRDALRHLPTPPGPPDDLLPALEAWLATATAVHPGAGRPVLPGRWAPTLAGALGVAAGVLLGLLLVRGPARPSPPPEAATDGAILALAFGGLGVEGGPRRGGGEE